ncbi:MAG: PQQ-binding-like beta-propeller repeat protein [Sedimentisphaerales bacterium]|nr:PQQ-binding-like beta-propeller repeat protein [Sedimentisphaerales bacterium]
MMQGTHRRDRFGFTHWMALAGLFVLAIGLTAAGADWPHWRGPDHNGISPETDWLGEWPAAGPRQLWDHQVGTGFSSIAVWQNKVYTMGNTATGDKDADQRDIIYCLDAQTGRELWKYDYACPLIPRNYEGGPCATPTVENNRVYTVSKAGQIHCLDATTGKPVWSRDLQKEEGMKPPTWNFAGSARIAGDRVLLNIGANGCALDKRSGKTLWKSDEKGAGYSTPVLCTTGGREAMALFIDRQFLTVDIASGEVLSRFPWKTSYDINSADPIFQGDRVFISSGYGTGAALLQNQPGECRPLWKNKDMRNQVNSCVLWQENLYGFDGQVGGDGVLKCIRFGNGQTAWEHKGLGTGSLIAADGKLIILGESGTLVIAEAAPAGYKPLRQAQVLSGKCWTAPVLANGRIYARNARGHLVCIDAKGVK